MTWMQCFKRVFAIDMETCPKCGGKLRVIACIEYPDVIDWALELIARCCCAFAFTIVNNIYKK